MNTKTFTLDTAKEYLRGLNEAAMKLAEGDPHQNAIIKTTLAIETIIEAAKQVDELKDRNYELEKHLGATDDIYRENEKLRTENAGLRKALDYIKQDVTNDK